MKCSFEQRSLSIVSKLAMVFVMILISISLCQLKPIEKAYAYQDGWSNDGSYWYYYANGSPVSGWQHIYHSGQWDDYYLGYVSKSVSDSIIHRL